MKTFEVGSLPSAAVLGLVAALAIPISASPVLDSRVPQGDGAPGWNPTHVEPIVRDAGIDQSVRDYWTLERMLNISSDDPVAQPPPITDEDLTVGQEYPRQDGTYYTVGRLLFTAFFTEESEWVDGSCTATLVESENQATLVTAAHCVHGSVALNRTQGFNQKFLWVPGFRDRGFPLGSFTVNTVVLPRVFTEEVTDEDRAFIVLNNDAEGRAPGETLGRGQGIAFNNDSPSLGEYRWHLGYPRYLEGLLDDGDARRGTPAFTGNRLAMCEGTAVEFEHAPTMMGVPCRMGGGCSGGPDFEDFDVETGYGTVLGVNSRGFGSNETGIWTTFLFSANVTDTASQVLWSTAQSIDVQPL